MTYKYNDVLLSELPYASVVKKELKKSICSSCCAQQIKLHACSKCNTNRYCNKDCQRADWKQHKVECKAFANSETYPNDISLLILRIICMNKNGNDSKPIGIKANNYNFKPRCFNDLVSNLDNEKSNVNDDFQLLCVELNQFLTRTEINFTNFCDLNKLKIIFAKSLTNNFEIQNDNKVTIGYGCYLNGSGLNHSCWPNAVYNFQGKLLVLQALKDIGSTEPVCINYTDPLQLREDRRCQLQTQYLFDCHCAACSDDELERVMAQLPCEVSGCKGSSILVGAVDDPNTIYRCDQCGQVEQRTAMQLRHQIHKAKLFHLNNLMLAKNYVKTYELSHRELDAFNLDCQGDDNPGGLFQLCYGEKAFESAIFMQKYEVALDVIRMKPGSDSWIHMGLSRFLGTANHPIAKGHLDKFERLSELCSC